MDPKEDVINTRLHMLEAALVCWGKFLACLAAFVMMVTVAVICVLFFLAMGSPAGKACRDAAPSCACR